MIFVTDKAKEKVTHLKQQANVGTDESYFLRVSVVGGGCSGLSYKLDFDNESKPNDQVFEDNGVKVVTDMKSFLYLYNTTLDFSDGLNVYINDLAFDAKGNPVILYVTGKGYEAGPEKGPRTWHTARYTGTNWEILPLTQSDNNYDMGSLYIDEKDVWRVVGPTTTGPQAYNTGGEMVLWTSKNQGKTWKSKAMTANSELNHSYARRPVNVHDDFYAFWADGHGRQRSVSHLYFSDKKGNVYQLPAQMDADFVKPIKLKKPKN